jgi:disulfide oxidoreductase YuzD
MERRFGDRASIVYLDVSDPGIAAEHTDAIEAIRVEGLAFPVTLIGEALVCDGAVSYPAILRAVDAALTGPTG